MTVIMDKTQPPPAPGPARKAPVNRRHRIPVDVAGKHGPAWGAVNVAGWLLAGGVAGVLFHAPWPWAPGFGFLGMCGALIAAGTRNDARPYTPEAFAYRAVCWIAGATWLTWVWAGRPGWVSAAVVLVGGTVVLGTLAPLASRRRRRTPLPVRGTLTEPQLRDERGRAFEASILKVSTGSLKVEVKGIADWDAGTGYTVDIDMLGVSWRKLRSILDDLAAELGLPNGCGVVAAPGIHRGRGLLHVATKDVTADERMLPREYGPLNLLNGLFVGWARDGAELVGDIREATWLIVGRKGSGKTTLMNTITAWLTRCTNTIVVVVDLNSGGLGVPWARAWIEGRAPQPAIEWLAGDPAEAGLVARAMLAVALGRKRRTGRLKRLANATLMPIGNGVLQILGGQQIAVPAEIVLIVDEGKVIFGDQSRHPDIKRTFMAVQELARDAGVNLVISALDGTSSSIDPMVKKQCEQRICMPVADEAEIAYVLDWNSGMKPEDLPAKGCGLAKVDGAAAPVPFRAPNMLPDQVDECSIAVAALRPTFTDADLSDISKELGAGVYERRWERSRYLFDLDGEEENDMDEQTPQVVPGPKLEGDLAGALTNMDQALKAAQKLAADTEAGRTGEEDDESWRRISPEEYATMQAFWAKTEELEAAIRSATDPVKRDALIDQLRAHRASALEGIEDTGMPEVEKARAEIDRLNAAWDMPEYRPPAEPEAAVKDWRTRARQLLKAAGAEGAGPQAIAERLQLEGFSTVRQTVSDWLSGEVAKKRAVKLEYGLYAYRDAA